jgi:hypothetical protein
MLSILVIDTKKVSRMTLTPQLLLAEADPGTVTTTTKTNSLRRAGQIRFPA